MIRRRKAAMMMPDRTAGTVTTGRPPSRRLLLCAAVLVLAAPVACWWLVGDLSESGADLDYAVRPVPLDPAVELLLGITAAAGAVASSAVLLRATVRRRFNTRWWLVLLPVVVAGSVAAVGWRVLTAGVYGANIGGGLAALLGIPAVAVLLVWAVAAAVWLLRAARRRRPA
jgi:hypothetical protein